MLSILQCLRDVANYIKGVDDYVVDHGTSGIWTYQKWKSGKCELWGSVSKNYAFTKARGGNMYSTPSASSETLPFKVKDYSITGGCRPHNIGNFGDIGISNNDTVTYWLFNVGASGTYSTTVFFHIVGKLGGQ